MSGKCGERSLFSLTGSVPAEHSSAVSFGRFIMHVSQILTSVLCGRPDWLQLQFLNVVIFSGTIICNLLVAIVNRLDLCCKSARVACSLLATVNALSSFFFRWPNSASEIFPQSGNY